MTGSECMCVNATVISPGSRVLISVDRPFSQQDAHDIGSRLRERFPDVEFTFIQGRVEAVMEP